MAAASGALKEEVVIKSVRELPSRRAGTALLF
jgi:hypothetical protein